MKAYMKLILIGLMAVGLSACGKDDSRKSSVRSPGLQNKDYNQSNFNTQFTQSPTGQSICAISGQTDMPGVVVSNTNFTAQVKAFLSGIGDPDSQDSEYGLGFGTISGQCGADTGVRFKIKANVSGGFNKNGGVNVNIEGGDMLIIAFDDVARDNEQVPGVGIYGNQVYGDISGDRATIVLEWGDDEASGTITLDGDFNAQLFAGTISYDNDDSFTQSGPQQGVLGQFSIPTCSIFNCN